MKLLWFAIASTILVVAARVGAGEDGLARYTCYRAAQPLRIDGQLDEAAWAAAPWSPPLVGIIDGAPPPPQYETRVALLWDEQYLYFAFDVPETDVWAALTERDDRVYRENDVEFFVDGGDTYYEFEINALSTVYDVFWIWRDAFEAQAIFREPKWEVAGPDVFDLAANEHTVPERGGCLGFIEWDFPGMEYAVHVDGTLNQRDDVDTGWTVEVALPWSGFGMLAGGRPLPPSEGDVWRIDCSRFETVPPERAHRGSTAGWTWNRHGHWDSHMPQTFTYVDFTAKKVPAASD